MALLLCLVLSILTVFYVIFFQVVVAAELTKDEPDPKAVIRIEQPCPETDESLILCAVDLPSIELVDAGKLFHRSKTE